MSPGPASHGLRRALAVDDVRIDVALDAYECRERSWRLGVAVSRGLANIVPARLDPVFRRRLARYHPSARSVLAQAGMATGKVPVVCAALETVPVKLWAIDPRSRSDAVALRLHVGTWGLELTGGDSADRATTELLFVAVGAGGDVVRGLSAGLDALERLCGGRSTGWMTWALAPRRVVVPLNAMRP